MFMENKKLEGNAPKRGKLFLRPGLPVSLDGELHIIKDFLSSERVVCKSIESGKSIAVNLTELEAYEGDSPETQLYSDLHAIDSEAYNNAIKRYEIIKPLLALGRVTLADAEARAEETKVGVASIYRWLKKFKGQGVISALVEKKRGWRSDKTRLDPRIIEVVDDAINRVYLSKRRYSINKTILEVEIQCEKLNLPKPHAATVRRRINKLSAKQVLTRRGMNDKYKNELKPAAGKFPDADYPLAVIQIDHTPVDLIIVDDESRQPIGRPWITVAIDIFSRCITGYYIGLEAPNANSVAMCISHSILPKTAWLHKHGITDTAWDVFGFPGKIHVDNGADFRTETLRRACLEYDINLEFRPVREAQYGGHIERLLGSFMKHVHDLPGTTFSDVKTKGDYKSEKYAAMTFSELEVWLANLIVRYYHNKVHSSIGMAPIKMWENAIWQDGGSGMPAIPEDPLTVELDFMPLYERTIQKNGVSIDGVRYYAPIIDRWIGFREDNSKNPKKFIFRRDPRNISKIWFFEPELRAYFEVPFADQSLPEMSKWELEEARKHVKQQGSDPRNIHEVRRGIEEMRTIVESSMKETKKARRKQQQRKNHAIGETPAGLLSKEKDDSSKPPDYEYDGDVVSDDNLDELEPFDED
ncbi:transposase [Aliidiomarina taiwanensis]|uniref:Transposase n=2 Tax=Aliidiomarina taiwanensis TaxID=946228 RepID=A0A432X763_9GAMM|nr:transposase [Aliidiomarina taiwanensis]